MKHLFVPCFFRDYPIRSVIIFTDKILAMHCVFYNDKKTNKLIFDYSSLFFFLSLYMRLLLNRVVKVEYPTCPCYHVICLGYRVKSPCLFRFLLFIGTFSSQDLQVVIFSRKEEIVANVIKNRSVELPIWHIMH